MFHGDALGDLDANMHHLGDNRREPLRLIRNIWRVPEVFMPTNCGALVVSSALKDELSGLPNLEFQQVEFSKKISFPYQAGDFSFYDTPIFARDQGIADPRRFMDQFAAIEEATPDLGPYYELIVARHVEIRDHFRNLINVKIKTYSCAQFELALSAELVRNYPIFKHGCHFASGGAWEFLAEHIDWQYFRRTEIELEDDVLEE
jgi:hypothetical protein